MKGNSDVVILGRAIRPNEKAILLAQVVPAAFDELAEGVRRYRLDRITRFRETCPDADLRLTTMVEPPDFEAEARDDPGAGAFRRLTGKGEGTDGKQWLLFGRVS